jgi:hypothetical protein
VSVIRSRADAGGGDAGDDVGERVRRLVVAMHGAGRRDGSRFLGEQATRAAADAARAARRAQRAASVRQAACDEKKKYAKHTHSTISRDC